MGFRNHLFLPRLGSLGCSDWSIWHQISQNTRSKFPDQKVFDPRLIAPIANRYITSPNDMSQPIKIDRTMDTTSTYAVKHSNYYVDNVTLIWAKTFELRLCVWRACSIKYRAIRFKLINWGWISSIVRLWPPFLNSSKIIPYWCFFMIYF